MAEPSEAANDPAYDEVAELYAELFVGNDLTRPTGDREQLNLFASMTHAGAGPVLDLGCGPGHIAAHLHESGLDVVGYDVSPNMIAEAQRLFPAIAFAVGDLGNLPVAPSSVGGIVSRHSIIHHDPATLPAIFAHWAAVIEPGAPLFVSFFTGEEDEHGQPFDHTVTMGYQLSYAVVASQLETAGFGELATTIREPLEGERPLRHANLVGRYTATS